MGEHAGFIWAAYAAAAFVLVALTVYVWADLRRQQALLGELEARGATRRRKARAPARRSAEA